MHEWPPGDTGRAAGAAHGQRSTDRQEKSRPMEESSRQVRDNTRSLFLARSRDSEQDQSAGTDRSSGDGGVVVPFPNRYVPRVSVVIPTLNEEKNLPHVLSAIPGWVYEVVLVDGNSTDRTVDVAREVLPDVRVVYQSGKGKGNALRAGFAAAAGEIIVMLDADGSTNPAEIPAFVGALLAGADYAKGSRFIQGGGSADMTSFRRFGHGMLVQLVRATFGCNFSDLCYGYNAFWAHVLPHLSLDADGFEIETLMNVRALKAGLNVVEVHSFEERRLYGEGRLRAIPDGWRVLKTIVKERLAPARSTRPRPSRRSMPGLVDIVRLAGQPDRKRAVGE
jgi:hypothetical protein